jgi:hypothetical protein
MLKDLLGDEKAEIISEEIGVFMEQMKLLGWKDMKPWQEFFGAFTPPPGDYKGLEDRIVANFLQYRTNYLTIVSLIFILRILFAPILFLCILTCVGLSYVAIIVVKGPLSVGEFEINETGKISICGVFSFLFLGLCGALEHFLWGLVISLGICCVHMLLRPRTLSSSGNKAYEEFKLSASQWFSSSRRSPSSADRQIPGVDDDVEASSGYGSDPMSSPHLHPGGLTSASMRKRTGK